MNDPVKPALTLLDGRFQLEGLLGRGGMADVFRATDLRHHRTVAVKVLRDDVLDALGVERFRREIAVTSAFTHPHILAFLESGETVGPDGRPVLYYVMPFIEGETLSGRLAREDHLPLRDAVRLAREVLEALRYAHEHGVIHRDIKPENILLSGGHAVVADFGIARPIITDGMDGAQLPSLTISGIAIGTPAYMSPEQAFASASVDARCDVYAAGCVFYQMLTGRPPFDATTGQAIMARKMAGVFVPPAAMRPGLPLIVNDIVASALQPDPADRYPSAVHFLTALDQIHDDIPSRPMTAQTPWSARHPWRRRVAFGSVLALLLLALGVWALSRAGTGGSRGQAEALIGVADPSRVAVLPFENLSADTSLAYVANGLTTDLIDELAQVPALTVVSKNGVQRFLHTTVGVDSIARALRVGTVITGDVRHSGALVRVSVRIVDGRTGRQLASHDTSGTTEEVLAVRSSVIEDAVRFLRVRLGEEVRASTGRRQASSAEAWELVERVRTLRQGELARSFELSPAIRAERFQHADSLAALASRLDRKWPDPVVERAQLALLDALTEETAVLMGRLDPEVGREAARRHRLDAIQRSDEALERDDGDAFALWIRGKARMELWRASRDATSDSLRALAEADLLKAVDRRPNLSSAWNDLGVLRQLAGDFAGSEQAAAEALRVDEYLVNAADVLQRLQFAALGAEQTENAANWCAEGRRRYPTDQRFFACELTTLAWTGNKATDLGRAWRILNEAEKRYTADVLSSGWAVRRLFVAAVAARAGLRDSALAIVKRTRAGMPSGASTAAADYGEAHVRALLGQRDDAIRLLDGYLAKNPNQRRVVARTPWFKSLRDDPRFIAMTQSS
jgi:serine/threonine-protein kinase